MDIKLLKKHIKLSGYKQSFIAGRLGITSYCLSKKIKGESDFWITEVKELQNLLKLSNKMRDLIFF